MRRELIKREFQLLHKQYFEQWPRRSLKSNPKSQIENLTDLSHGHWGRVRCGLDLRCPPEVGVKLLGMTVVER